MLPVRFLTSCVYCRARSATSFPRSFLLLSHSRLQERTALFARDSKNDEVRGRATFLRTNLTPTFLEYAMQTIGQWNPDMILKSLVSPSRGQSSKFTLNLKNGPMHIKVWMFLGVARTMVGTLLCCGVWIVQSLFNLLYDSTWPPHQGTPKLGTKVCTGPELTQVPIVHYRLRALQHLPARKLRVIWRFYTQHPRKKLACKFLHELLHANLRVFLRWLILLVINTRKLRAFLNISKRQQPMMADVKLETVIVEKRLFAVYIPIEQLYVTNKVSWSYYKSFQRTPPPLT